MKVHWGTGIDGIGNQYGFSVHDRESRIALEAAGVELVGGDEAKVHVVVGPPHGIQKRPGKLLVLYTAWEAPDMPLGYIDGLRNADVVVVPSTFLVDVCRKYTDAPVHYVPLGVDTELFCPPRRPRDPKHEGVFRWLWCGAPNPRKGWDLVRAVIPAFVQWGRMEIYFKTTIGGNCIRKRFQSGMTVIVDSRDLSRAELASLYQSAHGFLYPTRGEGFGLTLAEAMATALPCLYTPWTSCVDLADASCGFPLHYREETVQLAPNLPREHFDYERFAVSSTVGVADVKSMANEMVRVMGRYRAAAARGEKAAQRMQEKFTWDLTGTRLRAVIEKEMDCVGLN